jgi:hypothetical protein
VSDRAALLACLRCWNVLPRDKGKPKGFCPTGKKVCANQPVNQWENPSPIHSFSQSIEQSINQSSNQSEKTFPSHFLRVRGVGGIQRPFRDRPHSTAQWPTTSHNRIPRRRQIPFESGLCRSARDTSAGCATFPCWRFFAQARVAIGGVISPVCGLGSFFLSQVSLPQLWRPPPQPTP